MRLINKQKELCDKVVKSAKQISKTEKITISVIFHLAYLTILKDVAVLVEMAGFPFCYQKVC